MSDTSLRARLPPGAPLAAWVGLDAWWKTVSVAVAARWPELEFEAPLLDAVAARLANFHRVDDVLGEDLVLAAAASVGDPAAVEEVSHRLTRAAHQALAPMRLSTLDMEEAAQRAREALLVLAPGRRSRLSTYSGRGALDAWLRAVVARQALTLRPSLEALAAVGPSLQHPGPGAESQLREAEHGAAVRAALEKAFKALTPRQRTLLRLHGLDHLSLASIGIMYGKDASTVSRWLSAAREAVRAQVTGALRKSLRLDSAEVQSLLRSAGVGSDATLERLLTESTPRPLAALTRSAS